MTSIERTAYPKFSQYALSPKRVEQRYTPTSNECHFIQCQLDLYFKEQTTQAHRLQNYLNFTVLLKCFQKLGYFPSLNDIPEGIVSHVRNTLNLPSTLVFSYKSQRTLYRHQNSIRQYLNVKSYSNGGHELAIKTAEEASKIHNYPADILNTVLEELIRNHFELPAFSTLDRLVRHIRHKVNQQLFFEVYHKIGAEMKEKFDSLTQKATRTDYDRLKSLPKSVSVNRLKILLNQNDWLTSFGNMESYLSSLSQIKLKQFAGEAKSLDASDIKDVGAQKRYTLIACLIHYMQMQTKDHLAIMLIKAIAKVNKKAKDALKLLQEKNESKTFDLLTLLGDIAVSIDQEVSDEDAGKIVKQKLDENGGSESIAMNCEEVAAYHSDNYLPLLWKCFRSYRSPLIRLLRSLNIQSNTHNDGLVKAKEFLLKYAHLKRKRLPAEIDISFASTQWRRLIAKKIEGDSCIIRNHFEACVFNHIATALKSVDLWIEGSASFTDFRRYLLPWSECEKMLNDYCNETNLPKDGKTAVHDLRQQLNDKANAVDKQYPKSTSFIIDEKGNPTLKKRKSNPERVSALKLEAEIKARMPERNLIDILTNVHHYSSRILAYVNTFSGQYQRIPLLVSPRIIKNG